MPQMAPMFWTLLMSSFTLIFFLLMVKLYFYPSEQCPQMNKKPLIGLKNQWMW
uniref:ATP synthase 8 n=1 Tax=Proasellus escolai TaxID=1281963 RepID=A0A485MAD9_9CRUS|nr:ATP synthase 8 [Proasellus escolai]